MNTFNFISAMTRRVRIGTTMRVICLIGISIVPSASAENIQARQIVFSQGKQDEAIQILLKTRDFSWVATENSIDPNGKDGGYLGLLSTKDLQTTMANRLAELALGQVSKPIELNGRFFLFQRLDAFGPKAIVHFDYLFSNEETILGRVLNWLDGGKRNLQDAMRQLSEPGLLFIFEQKVDIEQLDPFFSYALFSVEKGRHTRIVRTKKGYYILLRH